jgi:deoxyadenosine/deoxycytidine kinase
MTPGSPQKINWFENQKMHKIAIEGEIGTGKTTLAKAIASDLSIVYFPENLKELYENLFKYKKAMIDNESEERILFLLERYDIRPVHPAFIK